MKKTKILLMIFMTILSSCLILGCSKEEKENSQEKEESSSIALTLSKQFKEEIKDEKNLEKIANNIAKNEILEISTDVAVLKESDYLSGFQTEIKGFKKAVTIRPIIGTIPFIVYIFEVEESEKFAETLKQNADLRWNICTEADDLEVTTVDNYVFFVMSPSSFDEE